MLKNYSRVRILTDKYENEGILIRSVGYVIEAYDDEAYEVEFSDSDGETIALLVLEESELELSELSGKEKSEHLIILEPDVRKYFPDSESVNHALRCLIPLLRKGSGEKTKHM